MFNKKIYQDLEVLLSVWLEDLDFSMFFPNVKYSHNPKLTI